MSVVPHPSRVFVEASHAIAIDLVDNGSLNYSAFSVPIPFLHSDNLVSCDVLDLGDVLLSLHVYCNGLKSVELVVYDVALLASYFVDPHNGVYEAKIPICCLNVPTEGISLRMMLTPGACVHSIVATYVLTGQEERMRLLTMCPDGVRHTNMLDVALNNGMVAAMALFSQDGP